MFCLFSCTDPATTEIYTLSLHDALPISLSGTLYISSLITPPNVLKTFQRNAHTIADSLTPPVDPNKAHAISTQDAACFRSEEHTSELQSRPHLVCRLLLEKKKQIRNSSI